MEGTNMAQKVNIILVSDLSGEEMAKGKGETVTFGLDGNTWEIDLTNKEADKFRGLFQDYIAVGRKTSAGRRGAGKKPAASGPAASEIREWAQAQGLDIPSRGRIPQEIRDQYEAAH